MCCAILRRLIKLRCIIVSVVVIIGNPMGGVTKHARFLLRSAAFATTEKAPALPEPLPSLLEGQVLELLGWGEGQQG